MNKTVLVFASAILSAAFNLPLCAETALEQFGSIGLKTELPAPQPAAASAGEARLSAEDARKKLPLFDYRKADALSVTRSTPVAHKGYSVEEIELLISDPLRQLGEFKQQLIFYRAAEPGPHPTVLVFPPFMPQKIDDWSATHFTKKGFNAIIIAPSEALTDTSRPLNKVSDMLIRGVISARMCIDLLETFPEVDKDKIYAYGISMGGIRTSLIFGVEPRVKKALEIVGGGDLPGIIADTHFKLLKTLRDERMRIEGIANLEEFRTYMKKVTMADPLDFAALRNPEDIFMVVGTGDRIVPDLYQKKLYAAFSRPAEGRYPLLRHSIVGHYPTAVKYGIYIDRFARFVNE